MWLFCDFMRLCYFSKWTWIFAYILKVILKSAILWYGLQKFGFQDINPIKVAFLFHACLKISILCANLALASFKLKVDYRSHMHVIKYSTSSFIDVAYVFKMKN